MDATKVINGTFGQVWINDDEVMEATALTATVDYNKDKVQMVGRMATGQKVTGWSGKGTLKANHVTSRFINLQAENIKNGKTTVCTIISKLKDPDSYGAERIALKYVIFDNIPLAEWEAAKVGAISIGFTFEDFENLDLIDSSLIQ